MSLRGRLEALIAADGPITIADYMSACLHDPQFGYYATRPRLGAEGDFITAPLISQMFGELIGVWAVEVWTRLGRPDPFRLIEVGPGDGALMSDLLRAARPAPEFLAAADLWLLEPSGPLRTFQAERLSGAGARWADRLEQVPGDAPVILVANEVLDCLPARQFVRTAAGWAERRVGLRDGALAFGLSPAPPGFAPPTGLEHAPAGVVVEVSEAQQAFGRGLGERIGRDGGCALLIDYGRDRPEPGDTLQALHKHSKVDPLEAPGEADLTVHADFPAVAAAARETGAAVSAPATQQAFLRRLGVDHRAAALARARPDRADLIARQHARLTGPDQMGTLFKALTIHTPALRVPGFEEHP